MFDDGAASENSGRMRGSASYNEIAAAAAECRLSLPLSNSALTTARRRRRRIETDSLVAE